MTVKPPFPTQADLARDLTAANGCDVALVQGKSLDLAAEDLVGTERADVLVTEIFDQTLLGEGCLLSIADAKRRLLVRGAKIIPSAGEVWFAAVERRPASRLGNALDLDLDAFNVFACDQAVGHIKNNTAGVKLQHAHHTKLVAPTRLFRFDFESSRFGDSLEGEKILRLPILAPGKLNAFVLWFKLDLDHVASLSTGPDDARPDCSWLQTLRYFPFEMNVRRGDHVTFHASHTDANVLVRIDDIDAPHAVTPDTIGHTQLAMDQLQNQSPGNAAPPGP